MYPCHSKYNRIFLYKEIAAPCRVAEMPRRFRIYEPDST
nr:MAG TPA: hypothetical protein [Caudoviricetes sp.]